jgi:hypothetical protein
MNYLVIYPGRFHPFHLGHKASYDYLVKKYGVDAVYIATSDKQAPVTSPFSYSDKVEMMTKLGVPAGHVVKVKNPYQATEITDNLSPEQKADTVLIFAVSAKDAERFNFKPKKDGSASYIQSLSSAGKKLQPMTKAAYIDITPTVNFQVRGKDASSATVVRQLFIDGNDSDRDQIITDLYGAVDSGLRDMFKQRLGVTDNVVRMMQECRRIGTARSLALMERIIRAEREVLREFAPTEPNDDGGDLPPEIHTLANRWWNATDDQPMITNVLRSMGWSIAQVESEDDAVQLQYRDGATYFVSADEFDPDLFEDPDYIDEKWSKKYKSSINCANPRGFSQRAHCAGRKK